MSEKYTPKPNNLTYERREDPKVYISKKPANPPKKINLLAFLDQIFYCQRLLL